MSVDVSKIVQQLLRVEIEARKPCACKLPHVKRDCVSCAARSTLGFVAQYLVGVLKVAAAEQAVERADAAPMRRKAGAR